MDIISFIIANALYVTSLVSYALNNNQNGFYFLLAGIFFHTLNIISRWFRIKYPPFLSLYEILILFSWALIFNSLLTGFYKDNGIFVVISAAVILGVVCFINPGVQSQLPDDLKTVLFPIHVALNILAYGAFFISFIAGILYLSAGAPGFFSYSAVLLGEIFFTPGIVIGSIWAKKAWDSYWSWDPKETAALFTWLLYAALLFAEIIFRWNPKLFAYFAIALFPVVIFGWFGINYIFNGHHSYKQ